MKPLLILALPLLLAACTRPPQDAPAPAPAAQATAGDAASTPAAGNAETLSAYHWHLDAATSADGSRIDALLAHADKPLQLDFSDGRIAVGNTCNHMGGDAKVEGDSLVIGQMISTQMACADTLMAKEREAGMRLAGRHAVTLAAGDPPRLELVNSAGDTLAFIGTPTARTRFGAEPERVFLEVAAERVDCHHPLMPDSRCLQVRELQYDDGGVRTSAGDWDPLYQEIEGYDHQAGTRNVLRLDRYPRRDVPVDAPAVAYVLDMVVESELVPAE